MKLVRFQTSYNTSLLLNSKDAAILTDLLCRNPLFSDEGYGKDKKYTLSDEEIGIEFTDDSKIIKTITDLAKEAIERQ